MNDACGSGLVLDRASYAIPRTRRGEARTIIKDASLRVHPGERVGLLGANGVGKSTLLRVLAGMLRLDSGELSNDGVSARAQGRGFQRSVHLAAGAPLGFYPRLTGAENLRFLAGLWGVSMSRSQAVACLVEVGLAAEAAAQVMYAKYSLGMRQRLHLAALWADPGATTHLLDEPTTGLDEAGHHMLRQRVLGAGDKVQVLVSHDADFLGSVCTRTVRLDDARLVG
ncbi:ABC transporter ATP-binding protein [Arachnia propionica]|nr:ABC transporter ATP-binding protein [Arachnia propionica]